MSTVYNMPAGVPFLRSLAHGLQTHYGDALQTGLVLLPTRRAARALEFAFVQEAATRGIKAALLPRLRPLADVNREEPPFEPGELAGRVAPAIDPVQRWFEIARLVAQYHNRTTDLPLDPAAALHMADPLIDIMDDAALEEVGIANHAEWQRVTQEAATHFQHSGTLYQIIDTHWPERLRELGMMEPTARRVALLNALAEIWAETPPDYPIVVAGSTGTLKATARLMTVIANMPNGMVVLPGLQEELPQKVWDTIDLRHPQFSLKSLLEIMDVSRESVPAWPWLVGDEDLSRARKRRRILAEALVPVDATGDWLKRIETLTTGEGADVFETALEGLSLIEARNDAEEALSIALILREALESKGKTAALVTPDQSLAQRVRACLARWNVDVAMSQGVPVEQTPIGVFLSALMELSRDPDGPVELSLVLSHELTALGRPIGEAKTEWEMLERQYFRGIRPTKTFDLVQHLRGAVASLLELEDSATPDHWAAALVTSAEAVARAAETDSMGRLWSDDAGRQAGSVLDGLVDHGFALPETDAEGFSRLLSSLLQGSVVRPSRGTHPRLSILGPLEVRLLDADIFILGGLNEGSWPGGIATGPFLSRGMRQQMKLSLPERRYGLAAHDFAELAANRTVFLTRSLKDESGPTVASRWVWRLKTLLAGAMGEAKVDRLLGTGQAYLDWARALDQPSETVFIDRPNPNPPVEKRWARQAGRRMSITGVAQWIRDPYSVFGKHVLRLDPLDPLDAPMGPREIGNAIHKAIENYIRAVDAPHSADNRSALIAQFADQLRAAGYADEEVFKEQPRLEALTDALINWFAGRRADRFKIVGSEIKATYTMDDLAFSLIGYLDLVERGPEGFAFTDFKTGQPPSGAEVATGFDLQLPLAGWLAGEGALDGVKKGDTAQMGYIRAKGSGGDFKYSRIDGSSRGLKPADELIKQSIDILRKLIIQFDDPDIGYSSQPRAKYVNKWGDYDDLARRAEWSSIIGGEE